MRERDNDKPNQTNSDVSRRLRIVGVSDKFYYSFGIEKVCFIRITESDLFLDGIVLNVYKATAKRGKIRPILDKRFWMSHEGYFAFCY